MRISDWSSDVCSSDLLEARKRHVRLELALFRRLPGALHRLLHLRLKALQHLARLDADPHRAQPSPVAEVADLRERQGNARQMNAGKGGVDVLGLRSEEQTRALQSLMRLSYAVVCMQTNKKRFSL